MQSPAGSSSPVNHRAAAQVPDESGSQLQNKNPPEKKDKKAKNNVKRKLPQSRQQGIVIPEPGNDKSSYVKVAKKLKEGIDMDKLGVKFTQLEHTKNGAISMTVGRGAEGVWHPKN